MSEELSWQQIADGLAYALDKLQDDPTDLTAWRPAFKQIEHYEKACKAEMKKNRFVPQYESVPVPKNFEKFGKSPVHMTQDIGLGSNGF
jgi:hypothetical protein